MPTRKKIVLPIGGREVAISNPDKIYFPVAGYTKLQVVEYYVAVAEGALRAFGGRPMALKRYVDGVEGEFFYQKRAPTARPDWIEVVELRFPSGRTAEEVVVRDAGQLAWVVNLGCVDMHPHPVRAEDLDHPDELRIDLDPVPGVDWAQIREVAMVTRAVLEDHGLRGWPKTTGSRGVHVYARIQQRWGFDEVRHAALAVAREVERRAPSLATSRWWKEERHGVFLDYNQNAKDRTTAAGYSVRPTPDARVSWPLTWDELRDAVPEDFTLATVPARFAARGDAWRGIDAAAGDLASLLELSSRQRAEQGEAPLPPHFAKAPGEPPRVQPSRRRAPSRVAKVTGDADGAVGEQGEQGEAAIPSPSGRRKPSRPLITVARAQRKEDALAGLERWKARHASIVHHLADRDILVDGMRGRITTWTRVRVNLEHVPEAERPPEEAPDPDFDVKAAR